jgi:hypothetical protein
MPSRIADPDRWRPHLYSDDRKRMIPVLAAVLRILTGEP